MRTLTRTALPLALAALTLGCDSAMTDMSFKADVTGQGPKEPTGPGKAPGPGKVDLGEANQGGPIETRAQGGPAGAPRPVASPDGKAH